MTIVLFDDDIIFTEAVRKYISKKFKKINAEYFSDGALFLQRLEKGDVDAVILDIELDGDEKTGVEYGIEVVDKHPETKIIFYSSYSAEYCESIFLSSRKLKPFGIINKSADFSNIGTMIADLISAKSEEEIKDSIFIKLKEGKVSIPFESIIRIRSEGRKMFFYTTDGKVNECYGKLDDFAPSLPECFARCHKSHVINLGFVESFDVRTLTLRNGEVIPISRSCLIETKKKMLIFVANR